MTRDVPFDKSAACDICGKKGAYDFMGDFLCSKCLARQSKIMRFDNKIKQFAEYMKTNEKWSLLPKEQAVLFMFIDWCEKEEKKIIVYPNGKFPECPSY